MRRLLDMNLPQSLARSLRSAGHDAVHARELGLRDASDYEVFARAIQEARTVVTCDLDFGDIVRLAAERGTGVVLLRLRSAGISHMSQRLVSALAETEQPLASGALVLVEDARVRIRPPPGVG